MHQAPGMEHDDPKDARRSSRSSRASKDSLDSRADFIARLTNPSAQEDLSQRARPRVLGIHHLKFAVANLDVSLAWYQRVLGAKHIPSLDHVRADGSRFAAVLYIADWSQILVELRQNAGQAQNDRGWDPITLSVEGKQDLEDWIEFLNRWGTPHSPLLVGLRGWLLVFEDPDGRRVRMYTKEEHGGPEAEAGCDYPTPLSSASSGMLLDNKSCQRKQEHIPHGACGENCWERWLTSSRSSLTPGRIGDV